MATLRIGFIKFDDRGAAEMERRLRLMVAPLPNDVELHCIPSTAVDPDPQTDWVIHSSYWQWSEWYRHGGRMDRASVIRNPGLAPTTAENLRQKLGIPTGHAVAGLLQDADLSLFNPLPLASFELLQRSDRHFVLMNADRRYQEQAQALQLKNVHFVSGHENNKRSQFLNTLDFLAHERQDGDVYGAVLVDALAHGKPCLSHTVKEGATAAEEIIGPCGFFTRDAKIYAQAMDRLLSDDALRARLAAKASAQSADDYSFQRGSHDLMAIRFQLLGQSFSAPNRPIPYGVSPLGFKYAGLIGPTPAIANHVVVGDIPEESDVHLVRFFLPRLKTFFDVGANSGLYGFVAAQQGLRTFMFEPQADCCVQMNKTIWLNNWEDHARVIHCGLSDRPGELALHISGTGSTFNQDFIDRAATPTVTVEVDTLDHQVEKLGHPPVDFIKIDTEGFEQQVLNGAAATIQRDKPILFIEIADRIRGRSYQNPRYVETLQWLAAQGYRVWRCKDKGILEEAFPIAPQDHLWMYVALHAERHRAWIRPFTRWMRTYSYHARWVRIGTLMRFAWHTLCHPWSAAKSFRRYRRDPARGFRF